MKIINILLFPFSLLYGFILYLRNKFYDWNIFKSTSFDFSVISVGNLAMAGTGKTPHVEYLVRLLKEDFKVATLSRGYKRSTKGFCLSDGNSTVSDIGDEPLQYKLKFPTIPVAVDEKRVKGIRKLKEIHPDTNVVLLDDAYQHRAVKPGINILLTDYNKLYVNDFVIPSGSLREWSCGSNRSDIIIVSKTNSTLSSVERKQIKKKIKPKSHQQVYFSFVEYGELIPITNAAKKMVSSVKSVDSVLMVTGIARAKPLFYKLNTEYGSMRHIKFPDHHNYTDLDIVTIKDKFNRLDSNNKIIITTEKDIMRLSLPEIIAQLEDVPVFYIPIEVHFHGKDKKDFDGQILKYVTANSRN